MKAITLIFAFLMVSTMSFSQNRDKKLKDTKLSKEESANLTTDQRYVHETNRKSKQGKKKVSLKQKTKIQRKQARASERMKTPKATRRKNPKG